MEATMSESVTLQMIEARVGRNNELLRLRPSNGARLLREVAGARADLLSAAEFLVRDATSLPEAAHIGWESAVRLIGTGAVEEYDSLGRRVQTIFDGCAGQMADAILYASELEHELASPVRGLVELKNAAVRFVEWSQQAMQSWPWPPTEAEWRRACAEMARGEGTELDAAFAEIAGVSKEEWLRRAEERKRQLAGGARGA